MPNSREACKNNVVSGNKSAPSSNDDEVTITGVKPARIVLMLRLPVVAIDKVGNVVVMVLLV